MAEFPALPLWTDAYLADCDHLTDAEHGRYFRLLMAMWRAPDCRLPNDDGWLARKFRRSVEEVRSELRPLIAEFCKCDGNWITQARLLREWKWCISKRKKNSDAAKSKWRKEKASSERNSTEYNSGNAPTPTPTPTPKEEISSLRSDISAVQPTDRKSSNRTLKAKPRKAEPDGFPDWYSAFPRHVARPSAAKAYAAALGRGASPVELLAGARRYAEERTGENPQFTKHPATWLNNDGWLDEPKPAAPPPRDTRPTVKILSILEEEPCP